MKRELSHQVQSQLSTLAGDGEGPLPAFEGRRPTAIGPRNCSTCSPILLDAEVSEELARELVERRAQRSARPRAFPIR